MVVGANSPIGRTSPHLKDRREAVVFMGSFLSVLFLDLFGAVVVGSVLAIAYSKWEHAHPSISLRGNVLKVRGNIYYGSLPVIEATYHSAFERMGSVVLDFSECYYIDQEGIRWLAAAKAGQKVDFVPQDSDRRAAGRTTGGELARPASGSASWIDGTIGA
jgi:SulP family sulfate permease